MSNRNKHRLIGIITQTKGGNLIRQTETERRKVLVVLQRYTHLRCVHRFTYSSNSPPRHDVFFCSQLTCGTTNQPIQIRHLFNPNRKYLKAIYILILFEQNWCNMGSWGGFYRSKFLSVLWTCIKVEGSKPSSASMLRYFLHLDS